MNIREDKGYTYSPRSALRHGAGGVLPADLGADVATEVTAPALVEIGYELGRMVSLPPTADEVTATAQYLVGILALSTATQAGLAGTLTALLADGLDVTWLREHPAALIAVTPEDVHEVAQTLLAPATRHHRRRRRRPRSRLRCRRCMTRAEADSARDGRPRRVTSPGSAVRGCSRTTASRSGGGPGSSAGSTAARGCRAAASGRG